jgi:hypothetical protein
MSGCYCRAQRLIGPGSGGRMFGRHKLLRTGVEAQAVVTSARAAGAAQVNLRYSAVSWRLVLKVYFADGSTDEVACHLSALRPGLAFSEGDTVPVRYDAADRSKVAVDVPRMEAFRKAGHDRAAHDRIDRAEGELSAEMRSKPGAAGSTREYVKAELERARRFNTPIGIRVFQKLQEAWVAGEIKVDDGDELAMRAAFETLKAQIRRDVTAELERPAS